MKIPPSIPTDLTPTIATPKVQGSSEQNAGQRLKEAETVAKEFESLFMDQIVKGMRKTVPTDESSNALGIYTDMLDSEHAKTMTESREFGIRKMIMDWMKTADPKIQE
jgi:peptidoglycan hydrolase FlgJ